MSRTLLRIGLTSIFRAVDAYLRRVQTTLGQLSICAYAFVAVVVLNVAIPRVPQAQELGSCFRSHTCAKDALMMGSVVYCALCMWFAAAFSLQIWHSRRNPSAPVIIRSTLPFWFAMLVLLSAVGLVWGYDRSSIFGIATLNYVALIVLLLIPLDPKVLADIAERVWPGSRRRMKNKVGAIHAHLANFELVYLTLLIALGAMICIATIWPRPVESSRALTTWVLVYIAFGWWPLWGSLVFITLPRRAGWPSFWLVPIVWALIISAWNNNRTLAVTNSNRGTGGGNAPTIQTAVDDWSKRNGCNGKDICEMRIVAAQGGGLRAAYWTAEVLGRLDGSSMNFSRGVFAVSGVSGGSLGLVAYFSALRVAGSNSDNRTSLLRSYLSADHLAPVIGSLLFGNAIQWLIPVPVELFDRGRVFEANMSDIWKKQSQQLNYGDDVFDRLYSHESFVNPQLQRSAPLFFLNATNVETGKRFILSTMAQPVRKKEDVKHDEPDMFSDAYWAFDAKSSSNSEIQGMRVGTVVRASAAFPLVTPAIPIRCPDDMKCPFGTWGTLVDGGYFDDTALRTAYDIVDELNKCGCLTKNTRITVVYISNDPSQSAVKSLNWIPHLPQPPVGAKAKVEGQDKNARPYWGYEFRSILDAVVAVHFEVPIEDSLRGWLALERPLNNDHKISDDRCRTLLEDAQAKAAIKGNGLCEISLADELPDESQEPQPSLGWWLSSVSTCIMRQGADHFIADMKRKPFDITSELKSCRMNGAI